MHHCLCHLQIILQIQSVIIPRMWLWVHTHLQHCSCDVKGCLSQRVLPSNTSLAGAHHPPPLSSRSYAMTLNLDPLSIFCPEHKSLLFLLHFRFHGSPWLTPIKSAVGTNEYVVQGDRQACPLTDSLHSRITLYSSVSQQAHGCAKPYWGSHGTQDLQYST